MILRIAPGNRRPKREAMSFLLSRYLEEWNYFKAKLRFRLLLIAAIFLISTALFYSWFSQHPQTAMKVIKYAGEQLRSKGFYGPYRFNTCLNIFVHNATVNLLIAISGIIPFLFIPIWILLVSGNIVGAAIAALQTKGISALQAIFLAILPHAIFELPATFYSTSVGILICAECSRKLIRKQGMETRSLSILKILKNAVRSYVLIIGPLLALAAAIETFITPLLAKALIR